MCGRFALFTLSEALAERFGVPGARFPAPSYNIAPSRDVAAVRVPPGGGAREIALLRWGLVPFWAKDPGAGDRMINARAETAAAKPAFRGAMRKRRCLIPADGFYEWKREGGRKQPWYVRMADGSPFAFAGLWERWRGEEGKEIESCAILTTAPNGLLAQVYDRMPVILPSGEYALWLDPAVQDPAAVGHLLAPCPDEGMVAFPVRPLVNNPAVDDSRCIAPLSA